MGVGRVAFSDDMTCLLVKMELALLVQHYSRHLSFIFGLPRLQVLLLDSEEEVQQQFIRNLREDRELDNKLREAAKDDRELEPFVSRSVFQRTSVQQLIACLTAEGWTNTERTVDTM